MKKEEGENAGNTTFKPVCGSETCRWPGVGHGYAAETEMSDTQKIETEEDEERDDALEDTFPASDPIAVGGSTGPDDAPGPDTLEERPPAK